MTYTKVRYSTKKGDRTVRVFDTRAADNIFDPDGGRWVVFCEDHATLVNTDTRAIARQVMSQPTQFCSCCQGTCRTKWDAGMLPCPTCGREVKYEEVR